MFGVVKPITIKAHVLWQTSQPTLHEYETAYKGLLERLVGNPISVGMCST